MAKKEYTLTGKGSIHGNGYHYTKGDIIPDGEFKKLPAHHKKQFHEGRIDVFGSRPTKAQEKSKEQVDKLEARVAELEAKLGIAAAEDEGPETETGKTEGEGTKKPAGKAKKK